MPSAEERVPNPNKSSYRTAAVAVGTLILAAAFIGVWYALPPSANSPTPDGRTASGGRSPALVPHASPRAIASFEFQDGIGGKRSLADFRGKVVLLNVWATWCSPCRAEMPTLDRLQARLGGPNFEVVALSIDRDGQAVVKRFFDEIKIRALAVYVDPTAEAQGKLGVIGVPTTLLIDREGREVARYTGPKEWAGAEVIDVIARYLPPPKS